MTMNKAAIFGGDNDKYFCAEDGAMSKSKEKITKC
jgi:hypothetical protein